MAKVDSGTIKRDAKSTPPASEIKKTETFTFFEQMPLEERLLCMLASGKGRLSIGLLKGTTL